MGKYSDNRENQGFNRIKRLISPGKDKTIKQGEILYSFLKITGFYRIFPFPKINEIFSEKGLHFKGSCVIISER